MRAEGLQEGVREQGEVEILGGVMGGGEGGGGDEAMGPVYGCTTVAPGKHCQ